MTSRLRAPLLAALCCLLGFVLLLGVAYGSARAGQLDLTALGGLEAVRGPTTTPVAVWIAHLADPPQVIATVLVLMAVGFACGRGRQAIAAAALVGVAVVSAEILKVLLAHGRPARRPMHPVNAAAFPSGHATTATAVALAAVLVSPPRFRIPVALAAAAYAVGVCMSVLVVGWHFPSDVFGGMLVASFYFCLAVAALRVVRAGRPARGRCALPAGGARASSCSWRWPESVAAARAGDLAAFAATTRPRRR